MNKPRLDLAGISENSAEKVEQAITFKAKRSFDNPFRKS
jgi:hypothetical protein